MVFNELKIGMVFMFSDGRMREADVWIPWVKTKTDEARMLVLSGEMCDKILINHRDLKSLAVETCSLQMETRVLYK